MDEFSVLQERLDACFHDERGPGILPGIRDHNRRILGAIIPHGRDAGIGQAWAYKEIAESAMPDVFVLLSDRHDGGKTCVSNLDWTTPFGTVKCELNLIKNLQEENIPLDNAAHRTDLTALGQLPFLQFASKAFLKQLSIVSIMVGDDLENAAKAIQVIQRFKRPMVIAMCDFTHYGMRYGFVPPWSNVKEKMKHLDAGSMNHIKALDPHGLFQYTIEHGANLSGRNAVATLLDVLKDQAPVMKQLNYHIASDGEGTKENHVSHASIIFESI